MKATGSEIRVLLEELDDGRVRARSADGGLSAEGDDLVDVRNKMDLAILARYGEGRRVALVIAASR